MKDYIESEVTVKIEHALEAYPNVSDSVDSCINTCIAILNKADLLKYGHNNQILSILNAITQYLVNAPKASNTVPSQQLTLAVNLFMTDLVEILGDSELELKKTSKKYKVVRDTIEQAFTSIESKLLESLPTIKEDTPIDTPIPVKSRSKREITKRSDIKKAHVSSSIGIAIEMEKVILESDVCFQSNNLSGCFYMVPSTSEVCGVYWSNIGNSSNRSSSVQLSDCYYKIVGKRQSKSGSLKSNYVINLEVTTKDGNIIPVTVTSDLIARDQIGTAIASYGTYPTSRTDKDKMLEFILKLSVRSDILTQEDATSLGWNELLDGTRVWMYSNGCLTKDGFIESEQSPLYPPRIPTSANGYAGDSKLPLPSDSVMRLLLVDLNPNITHILAGMLGLTIRIVVPSGDYAGVAPFVTEIIGHTRHGKTALTNFFLSLFGTGFKYGKGTLLSNTGSSGKGDTVIARGLALALCRYVMATDFDNKVKREDVKFKELYSLRVATNNMFADDDTSLISNRNHDLNERAKQNAALVRTGETDYAEYSIEHNNLSNEVRANTFLWGCTCTSDMHNEKCEYISKKDISIELNNRRDEITVWGMAILNWFLHMTDDTILQLLDKCTSEAYLLSNKFEWKLDKPQQYTDYMVTGLLIFKTFLQEKYSNSFMIEWIDNAIPVLINDRVDRCTYIATGIKQTISTKLADRVIDIIREELHNLHGHLRTQQNKFIDQDYIQKFNISVPTTLLGYLDKRERANKISSSTTSSVYGYFVDQGKHIALEPDMLNRVKTVLDKENVRVSKVDIETALANAGYIEKGIVHNKEVSVKAIKIAKQTRYLYYVPTNVLFPLCEETEIVNTSDIEDVTTDNVSSIEEKREKKKVDHDGKSTVGETADDLLALLTASITEDA